MDYLHLYQRNIGIFSDKEQEKLKDSHVFIAGAGGGGGIFAALLARAGIGRISLMDPGTFDAPDLNRQYGATLSTLGKNKAIATGEILKDIAPFSKINTIDRKLSEEELNSAIKDCDLVIDAIDLQHFSYKSLFARIAREQNKYNVTAPMPDFGAVMIIFDPCGMTFEEFTNCKCYPPIATAINQESTSRKMRKEAFPDENIDEIPFLSSISTFSGAVALGGALVATETALILSGKRRRGDIVAVPNVTYIDLFQGLFKIFNPLSNT